MANAITENAAQCYSDRDPDAPKNGAQTNLPTPKGSSGIHGPCHNSTALGPIRDCLSGGRVLIKYSSMIIAAGMIVFGGGAASAQTAGDWVLGNYKGAGYWFPGIAEKVGGGKVTIRYDDGDRETVGLNEVRPYDWMIGMKVECNFKNAGDWYPGTIASLAGEKIGIAYDDGDKETTKTGRCRTK